MARDDEFAEMFRSIAFTPIATVVTDPRKPDNPIVAANDGFVRLTGYALDEVIGRNCRFLAGRGTDAEQTEILRQAIADARPVFAEIVNYRRDGSAFANAVMIAPLFDSRGTLRYFVGSQMDVGDKARARDGGADRRLAMLTRRQRQVLKEMALGYRNKQIAHRLGISEKTVKMHRAALLKRLEATSSADAIRMAVEAGL